MERIEQSIRGMGTEANIVATATFIPDREERQIWTEVILKK